MSIATILAACGMTADDVRCAVREHEANGVTLADFNERKYDGVRDIRDDFVEREFSHDVYGRIAAGSDNGECTTRRGTYRKLKTGNGLCATEAAKRVFDENRKMRRKAVEK